jgi:AcrR family transcriptional regulator
MSRLKNRNQWIESGFELFAQEGHEGIQVERLARILDRNKSGFYHYFGTLDNYIRALMRHLHKQSDIVVAETKAAQDFDPGFLNVMVKNKVAIMATMQLIRNRNVPLFADTFKEVTHKIDRALLPLWAIHIGVNHDPNLALRYFEMIRDMFFARITFDTLHYDYLHNMASEAKTIILELNQNGARNTQQ